MMRLNLCLVCAGLLALIVITHAGDAVPLYERCAAQQAAAMLLAQRAGSTP